LNQRFNNAFKNSPSLLKHLVIPEPNHPESAARKVPRPFQIVEKIVRMLTAVHFDDQARAKTDEVDNVISNRLLSAEAIVAEMSAAEMTPKTTFGVGRVRA
jgi:hypothetical protein